MKLKQLKYLGYCFIAVTLSCGNHASKSQNTESKNIAHKTIETPNFNADSAYVYIAKQMEFGPRVPNSEAHKACGLYLSTTLERFGAQVYTQETILQGFEHKWEAKNIIGSFQPNNKDRILLCAHWDSRYTSDRETTTEAQNLPVPGASDGASGVGILLEIARQLQMYHPNVGVDIVFFDVEDQGVPAYKKNNSDKDYWCLGSQYWSKTPHIDGYSARYGILLDMVGAKNAIFRREVYSTQFAPEIVNKVWTEALNLGYSSTFSFEIGGAILDDHYYVNTVAKIPTIDIIQYEYSSNSGFGHYWHTQADNMDIIDVNTLKTVGQLVTSVIFKEPF